jgi:hypothetical protein
MATQAAVACSLAVAFFGCSSSPTGGGFGSIGNQGSNPASGDDASAASGDQPGGGGGTPSQTADAGSSPIVVADAAAPKLFDAAAPPDANVEDSITLTADPFTVAPGGEVYKCQTFANPFGKDVDIIYMDGTMSAGSHHFFVFNMAPSTGRTQPTALQDCLDAGLEFHPFPYLSQQPHWIVNYPQPNMGYPLSAANALMLNVHYLNSGSTPIQAKASITFSIAKPGVVTTHVGTIFLNNSIFSVPPTPMSSPVPETKTWTPSGQIAQNYTIFTSWSHMHKWGLDFTASTNGQVFYEEKQWDSPPLFVHGAPVQMTSSQSISWTCSYYNDTGNTLKFGDSAATAVMCIYLGQYYPANPQNPDILVSQ